MRVRVLSKTDRQGPSSRYRFYQYGEALAAEGFQMEMAPLFGKVWFRLIRIRNRPIRIALKLPYVAWRFLIRLGSLLGAARADLVVVEHQLFPYLPGWLEVPLLSRLRPWILEFDDAIYLTPFHRAKIAKLASRADRVIVGNQFLARFAGESGGTVSVIPTAVDPARFVPAPRRNASPVTPLVVGWIGLPCNLNALKLIEAPLRRLHRQTPMVLRILSAGPPPDLDLPVETEEWSEEAEADWLREVQVGVMPLPDSDWSRGKCGLKILQFFAAGVPVVAAPSGVNGEIVRHGQNGFLAANDREWFEALERLAREPELRRRLGQAGRETVEAEYSVNRWTGQIAELWRSTVGART
ncbi:MAG: glycosyltransferase family 4 protein [Planctomycetota bacterium]